MNNILTSVTATNAHQNQLQSTTLAERADIHKSCKSLETLLNILNDYCEAATAITALQKKLAKALRETASLKVTNEIAGNALNASANIFEALAEVDNKFAKIADKEYDIISAEVKKWFKKLAKEEKAHDERVLTANAKIKQAGMAFEKKSKKKSLDAQEEHSRYVQLLSTLGPEITQEKYNHSLQMTQRHTFATYSVAACLSRIADAEWLRSCESVRRFSPTIGPLGEWRMLCEGGWTKDIPGDLPDPNGRQDKLILNTIQEKVEPDENEQGLGRQRLIHETTPPPTHQYTDIENDKLSYDRPSPNVNSDRPPIDEEATRLSISAPYPPERSPNLNYESLRAGLSSSMPVQPSPSEHSTHPHPPSSPPRSQSRDEPLHDDALEKILIDPMTGSIRSLSAFPAPPTHFPLPPPLPRGPPSQQSLSPLGRNSYVGQEAISTSREDLPLNESPLPMEAGDRKSQLTSLRTEERQREREYSPENLRTSRDERIADLNSSRSSNREEFGMLRNEGISENLSSSNVDIRAEASNSLPPGSVPYGKEPVEKADTGASGTGSVVPAMRSRYIADSGNSPSRSPPPRNDLPKLHTRVSDLATKYQSPPKGTNPLPVTMEGRDDFQARKEPQSPRSGHSALKSHRISPTSTTRRTSVPTSLPSLGLDPEPERRHPHVPGQHSMASRPSLTPERVSQRPITPSSSGRTVDNVTPERDPNEEANERARLRRLGELAELGFREKEMQLREREQEISLRERELEMARARLMSLRENESRAASSGPRNNSVESPPSPPQGHGPRFNLRPRKISLKRLQSQPQQQLVPPSQSDPHGHISTSTSIPNLRNQSHYSHNSVSNSSPSQEYFPTSSNSGSGSSSGYHHRSSNSGSTPMTTPTALIPPQEKKGWMRRLSMPVGNAFSLDMAKRSMNNSNNSTASSTSANMSSPTAGVKQLGAGIVGGKGVHPRIDERMNVSSSNLASSTGMPRQDHDANRFGLALGLGRRNNDAVRSATDLDYTARK